MERVRKRSMTIYESQEVVLYKKQEQINDSSQLSVKEQKKKLQNYLNDQGRKFVKYGGISSKKAKLFKKYDHRTLKSSVTSNDVQNHSTLKSLKKQALVIECDDFKCYRFSHLALTESTEEQESKNKNQDPEVDQLTKYSVKRRNQTKADKFRSKIWGLNKKKSELIQSSQKSCFNQEVKSKLSKTREKYLYQKGRSVTSATATRFYKSANSSTSKFPKNTPFIMDHKSNSIKKLKLPTSARTCSTIKSLLSI